MKLAPLLLGPWVALGLVVAAGAPSTGTTKEHRAGLERIDEDEACAHLHHLASPGLEGRDTPSLGQDRAEEYIARAFHAAGLEPWSALAEGAAGVPTEAPTGVDGPPDEDEGAAERSDDPWRAFLWGWPEEYEVADERSLVELTVEGREPEALAFGRDFHPLLEFSGEAEGVLAFCGYGIQSKKERFDELANLNLRNKIAVVLEGEPENRRKFEGPDVVTPEASLFSKLGNLQHEGVVGVVYVRRPRPERHEDAPVAAPAAGFGYRYGFAFWQDADNDTFPRAKERLPVVETTPEAASRLVGFDVLERAQEVERRFRSESEVLTDRRVRIVSATTWDEVELHNVVGFVRGSDPGLSREYVVVGAHHDHVGFDTRGRIGFGADDNASGVAALLEVAQALAASPPRRTVVLVTFNGEEDGLKGSQAFCERGPVDVAEVACMINLDMVGRGPRREVAVIGLPQNPDLKEVVRDAEDLSKTGIRKLDLVRSDRGLFKRSDHFSFHEAGVPSLFFFEGMPIEDNEDYHTWRDVPDRVDCGKIASAARLAYNTAWLLANADERPPPPRRR